jgi:hypothetical protein
MSSYTPTRELTMRTILIDPEAQTIEELDFEGNYKDIQRIIGCNCFTTVNIGNARIVKMPNDALFIDDEGLLNPSGFVFQFYDAKLVGKGLIIGCDDEGESAPADIDISEVRNNTQWLGEFNFNA